MINEFRGKYRFLSNFFPAIVMFEGGLYPTAEHAFVAAKTTDEALRRTVGALATAADAKNYGRTLTLRPDWEAVKFDAMYQIVKDKFSRSPFLRQELLGTGYEELVEGNWWNDRIWGVDLNTNMGQNHLGQILMRVRKEFRDEYPRHEAQKLRVRTASAELKKILQQLADELGTTPEEINKLLLRRAMRRKGVTIQ